jgi:hypothetical protein
MSMMLTRSAAKALLTNRYVLLFAMCSGRSAAVFNGHRVTIYNDKLPEDVLLEIFDAYRQIIALLPFHETLWNSRHGWFKLAHVCLHWRRVVLLSPSRLYVQLLFTPRRASSDPLLRCLPRLPIQVDYSSASWTTENEENLALSALEHRSRVRGIALRSCPDRLLRALSRPFPELESLDICSGPGRGRQLILPAMFLPSLQRLTLRDVPPRCLPPLLSSATGLVELALTLSVGDMALPEDSLIANLQRMSCLRRLELKLCDLYQDATITPSPPPPASSGGAVPLSELTDISFLGHCSYLEMLVVGLAAPSLQHLYASIYHTAPIFSIPHLCKFICDTENQFIALSLFLFQETLEFSANTSLTSYHARPFRMIFPHPLQPLEAIGNMLSGPLSTVEELVVPCSSRHIQWGGFFNHIRQLKVVQVPFTLMDDVAASLQQGNLLDLLPSLKQVKVYITYLSQPQFYRDIQCKAIRDAFEPLVAARRQVGRPIKLSWM